VMQIDSLLQVIGAVVFAVTTPLIIGWVLCKWGGKNGGDPGNG